MLPAEVEKGSKMRFILWDPKDNYVPSTDEEGNEIISDGVLGRLSPNNVYLTTYARYPDGAPALRELEVGECIKGVMFRLSGERGTYDIYRVA